MKKARTLTSVERYIQSPLYNKQYRCGVIPYTFYNKELYMCFGIYNNATLDINDFAGRKEETDESTISAALREFSEETRKVFGDINLDYLKKCLCIYNEKNLSILIPFVINIEESVKKYENFYFVEEKDRNKKEYNENKSIIWLNEKEIEERFIKRNSGEDHLKNMFGMTFTQIARCYALTHDIKNLKDYLIYKKFPFKMKKVVVFVKDDFSVFPVMDSQLREIAGTKPGELTKIIIPINKDWKKNFKISDIKKDDYVFFENNKEVRDALEDAAFTGVAYLYTMDGFFVKHDFEIPKKAAKKRVSKKK